MGIYLVSGQQYSVELVADAQFLTVSTQIPGASGVYGTNNPTPINWWFKTYVDGPVINATAQSAVSTSTANSVPWAGIAGVPSNVTNAFSPWGPVTGGIVYSGGKVGIGTPTPPNLLSVGGNADVAGKLGVGLISPVNAFGVNGIADISGRLGIGTTSPLTPLHIKGNAAAVNIEGTDHAFFQFFPFGLAGGRKAYFGVPSAAVRPSPSPMR